MISVESDKPIRIFFDERRHRVGERVASIGWGQSLVDRGMGAMVCRQEGSGQI